MKKYVKKDLILNYIKQNNLSVTAFCKLCKIDTSVYKKIMTDKINFRLTALFKIARVMKIEMYQLLY